MPHMIKKLLKPKIRRRRTPTLLQMEAVECGAAALGIILGYYGRIVPLTQLRQDCGVSRDGSKASNILAAARSYGMDAKGFQTDIDGLPEIECPYIIFWNFNHFLVVEHLGKERVYLNDPATGPRTTSLQEFSEAFTGVVLAFEPSPQFKRGGHKPSTIVALWQRLSFSSCVLIYSVVAGLLLAIPGLAIPTFSQVFVDNILVEGRLEWLSPLILAIILTTGVMGFLTSLQLQSLRQMKIKLSVGMSSQFLWHILRLPVSFYDQRFAGEISSRIHLNDTLADILSGKLATTLIACVTAIVYAVVMLQYDVVLTSIGIVFVALNIFALQWISRRRVDANMRLQQDEGKVSGVAISGLQSMETLKASGLESDFFSRWAGYYAKSINAQQELDITNQTLGILPFFLTTISSILLLCVGGLRVMNGYLSIGMLVAFQSLMQQFLAPVSQLVNLGSDLQQVEGDLKRLDDVLQNQVDLQVENVQKIHTPSVTKLQGYIELRNIIFGYNRVARPLIEDFNLLLKPGQRVALIGGSGSGKSTIAKLITGLYEPWQGEILFDGQPRSEIPRPVLVNSIALIEQEIFLFAGSVRDNLTLWDTTVPNTHLIRACKDAAIHDVVISLSGGYDAQLLESASNLSGGQRQRLEIARALVNNPTILVMDEATSALDTETEKIIDRKLRQRGCTCIIVAHRLSTIRDCDEIIVLEHGQVVQRGTHEELKHQEGAYLDLIRSEGDAM